MSGTQIKNFTRGNITPQLISFAWPLLLSNVLQLVYSMVDMVVVGQVLGKIGLSAVSVGGDVVHFLTFLGIGFSNAGQILIARHIGAKRSDSIGKFVGTMCGFLFVCALIMSAVSLIFRHQILDLMNTPVQAYQGALEYSTICMAGMLFIYGYNVVSTILRGMGDSAHPLIFIGVSVTLNVILDVLLVGVFPMGAAGAALATVISQGVSFISCTVFLVRRRSEYKLNIRKKDFLCWDLQMLGSLVKLGVPMAIKTGAVLLSKLFVNSWVNGYGVAVSAFAGVANKIASVMNLFSVAMNTAGGTMIGQNLAAGEFRRVKKILLRLSFITLGIAVVSSLILMLFPEGVFGLFTDDSAVLEVGRGYIPIGVLFFFGSALRAVMNALINGSGNTALNFLTAILDGIVLRIGLGLLFGLAVGMRHYGFWLGDALAGFTPFFLGVGFYISGKWKVSELPVREGEISGTGS